MNITGGESHLYSKHKKPLISFKMLLTKMLRYLVQLLTELQDELVTVIATGFNDKPSSARKPQGGGAFGGTQKHLPKEMKEITR